MAVEPCELPETASLRRYRDPGAYVDCYVVEVAGSVSHAAFVEAFYTTPLFKVERLILAAFVSRPSTDLDAKQLAEGRADSFAAWRVEDRKTDQLLLGDYTGRTKSWLMVAPSGDGTSLYFGSAVVPKVDSTTGERKLGFVFGALLGFHKLYSRLLLGSARSRILASR